MAEEESDRDHVSGVSNPNIIPNINTNINETGIQNANINTANTRNTTNITRNVLNSLIHNTEISQNDVYDMLNLLLDPSSNYVSLSFDITD